MVATEATEATEDTEDTEATEATVDTAATMDSAVDCWAVFLVDDESLGIVNQSYYQKTNQ